MPQLFSIPTENQPEEIRVQSSILQAFFGGKPEVPSFATVLLSATVPSPSTVPSIAMVLSPPMAPTVGPIIRKRKQSPEAETTAPQQKRNRLDANSQQSPEAETTALQQKKKGLDAKTKKTKKPSGLKRTAELKRQNNNDRLNSDSLTMPDIPETRSSNIFIVPPILSEGIDQSMGGVELNSSLTTLPTLQNHNPSFQATLASDDLRVPDKHPNRRLAHKDSD
ncbi:hypothetical protein QQS21_008615 [Conoideocrella luteorostrata]|uniref:Uncharacterized protein n=1 Tax=Conoideocrella luteorostrata TaxID=1105319 RepID=A0AAJ0CJE8_9HYPO|nr:hypothetical protein QQS21_008615 [Conoideocrella luteorostrata]